LCSLFSLELVAFKQFKDVSDAMKNINHVLNGKLGKTLKKVLKANVEAEEELAVNDSKLGNIIKARSAASSLLIPQFQEQLEISCVHNNLTGELMRGIRTHMDTLLADHKDEMNAMRLALSHSIGRYKVCDLRDRLKTMIPLGEVQPGEDRHDDRAGGVAAG
jgi:nucleolar protein 58